MLALLTSRRAPFSLPTLALCSLGLLVLFSSIFTLRKCNCQFKQQLQGMAFNKWLHSLPQLQQQTKVFFISYSFISSKTKAGNSGRAQWRAFAWSQVQPLAEKDQVEAGNVKDLCLRPWDAAANLRRHWSWWSDGWFSIRKLNMFSSVISFFFLSSKLYLDTI